MAQISIGAPTPTITNYAPPPAAAPKSTPAASTQPASQGNIASQVKLTPSMPFSTAPTLTANFTQPNQTNKITAPAVVTSQPAEDHVQTMHNAAAASQNDTTALAQHNAANTTPANAAPTDTATDKTAPAPGTPGSATNGGPDAQKNTASGTDSALQSLVDEIFGSGSGAQVNNAAGADIQTEQNTISEDQQTIDWLNDPGNPDGIPATYDAMVQMQNGTYPLTTSQQAQINAIPQAYSSAMSQAVDLAKNIQGGAVAANTGLMPYSPKMAMSNIAAAVQRGSNAIAKVNNNILNAQGKLQTALENQDYKSAASYMSEMDKMVTARSHEIDQINTAINREQTNMQGWLKAYVTDTISAARADATSMNNANNLAYKYAALTEKEYMDNQKLITQAIGKQTQSEKTASSLATFAQHFVPGATFQDPYTGNTEQTIDDNGYITPNAWKAAIQDAVTGATMPDGTKIAPMTRKDFITQFGSMLYAPKGAVDRSYGLTPAEAKMVLGVVPTAS